MWTWMCVCEGVCVVGVLGVFYIKYTKIMC